MLNKRPSSIWSILLSSFSTYGSLTSGQYQHTSPMIPNKFPFFSAIVIDAAPQPLEITCSLSGVVMWLQKSTNHFAWIGFKVVRVSLTSICLISLPSHFYPLSWRFCHFPFCIFVSLPFYNLQEKQNL